MAASRVLILGLGLLLAITLTEGNGLYRGGKSKEMLESTVKLKNKPFLILAVFR